MGAVDNAWARDLCLTWEGSDPAELLEQLMTHESCAAFGPVHHFLVGAALLTCAWPHTSKTDLASALDELDSRSSCVPGAACARWGICGASASCGMAFAILAQNEPLRAEGWSEGQLMVSDILKHIAETGAPRCCKRDSRIAVRAAVPWFNKYLNSNLTLGDEIPRCSVSNLNTACLQQQCPFFASSNNLVIS